MRRLTVLLTAVAMALAPVAPATVVQAQSRAMVSAGAGAQLVNLPRGSSMAIDLPADARDVIVSNPAVAEAVLHSPRRITIIGLAPGETDAVFLDAAGRSILTLRVRVDAGVSALQDTLTRTLPGVNVKAEAVNDSILLTGTVSSPGEADRVSQIARAFVSSPEKVINMMTIEGSDQVTVRARVIEVQRSAVKQLGFDVNAILNTIGDGLSLSNVATFAVSGSQLGGGQLTYNDANNDGEGLTGTIRAFERTGLVRILAEPNATSVSGENAEFLAGGEFPVPVGRDDRGNILIEFKPYGVRLAFRPIVLSGGRISLQLSTEVSELTTNGAFTLGGTGPNALVIPALAVRRTSNTVELPSGGSLMIAGLLREDTRQNIDQLPGIGALPVLGGLFRSRDYISGETELVIIIEAYIVSPTSPNALQTPADGLVVSGDLQTMLFGRLTERYGVPAPRAGAAPGWQGPVGYVIE
ncbi:MAG: type II and III secretion system protein family protein [Alphaproteobacteria bacterium]|nr:type II and III secretion system protein family protein [Alphaproteobacteria bacterium]MBU1527034.1 type II and III secretion system protein family protein [Alphaproteobacteria bacterium]MBU2117253.1 type II and III secretion system protein family protein [Alphaproteobacteria bacterium]MBU2352399.1 type II and III secretion system protein family protein [Alphaproteobacteria bacterium]MBU2382159.1 type II and III secretion system protein family protein [Alphaproteobacteria bacterium]